MTLPSLRKLAGAHSAAEIDGELVLIHRDTGKFFSLRDVGYRIWFALDDEPDLDVVCASMLNEYDVPADVCRDAIATFAEQLVAAGFAAAH